MKNFVGTLSTKTIIRCLGQYLGGCIFSPRAILVGKGEVFWSSPFASVFPFTAERSRRDLPHNEVETSSGTGPVQWWGLTSDDRSQLLYRIDGQLHKIHCHLNKKQAPCFKIPFQMTSRHTRSVVLCGYTLLWYPIRSSLVLAKTPRISRSTRFCHGHRKLQQC